MNVQSINIALIYSCFYELVYVITVLSVGSIKLQAYQKTEGINTR